MKLSRILGFLAGFWGLVLVSASSVIACGQYEVDTALGCIPVEMGSFMTWLLPKIFGIAGGISFLLMVWGFILIGTSSGDEKKVQGAKETITSAITGLLVCIFSIFILRLVALDILKIPGIN